MELLGDRATNPQPRAHDQGKAEEQLETNPGSGLLRKEQSPRADFKWGSGPMGRGCGCRDPDEAGQGLLRPN